jgi:hypothetical protein
MWDRKAAHPNRRMDREWTHVGVVVMLIITWVLSLIAGLGFSSQKANMKDRAGGETTPGRRSGSMAMKEGNWFMFIVCNYARRTIETDKGTKEALMRRTGIHPRAEPCPSGSNRNSFAIDSLAG